MLVIYEEEETRDEAHGIESFIQGFDVEFPILLDSAGSLVGDCNIDGVPAFFFIDPNSRVRDSHFGVIGREELQNSMAEICAACQR